MQDIFSRTQLLLGGDAMQKLANARVAVFGVGGVGGYVCEGLVRSGVGAFDLIDSDTVSPTNLNRQIIALHSTVGMFKCDVMKSRMLDINPAADITAHNCFFLPENADTFDFTKYDYVVDAVDTVSAKIEIILKAVKSGVPVISSMGAGNKLNPMGFKVADISETKVDPLARVMRHELKKRGVEHLKVVYTEEPPVQHFTNDSSCNIKSNNYSVSSNNSGYNTSDGIICDTCADELSKSTKKQTPGSVAFVPSVAGLIIASEVVKDLISK